MTKAELKAKLEAGAFLVDLFDFTYGQECLIYKSNKFESDNIIYIPDVDLNDIDTESVLEDEEIEKVLHCCYTGTDFLTLPMPKGRGFLVAAERYRLTSSFLIGRTPS